MKPLYVKPFILLIFLSSLILQVSCLKDPDEAARNAQTQLINNYIQTYHPTASPSASGLYYIETIKGTGDTVAVNDEAIFSYEAYKLESFNALVDASDKALATAKNIADRTYYQIDGPVKSKVSYGGFYCIGVSEGLLNMKVGGVAEMVMPGSIVFGDYTPFLFKVKLLKVIKNARQFEQSQIDSFFIKNNINKTFADTTGINADTICKVHGLYFYENNPGDGDYPVDGDSVTVKYTLSLLPYHLDSINYIPERIVYSAKTFSFKLGVTIEPPADIEGFSGAIKAIKKGGKAKVIIPFHRGYGNYIIHNKLTTQCIIPQNSTLMYNLEVIELKHIE